MLDIPFYSWSAKWAISNSILSSTPLFIMISLDRQNVGTSYADCGCYAWYTAPIGKQLKS